MVSCSHRALQICIRLCFLLVLDSAPPVLLGQLLVKRVPSMPCPISCRSSFRAVYTPSSVFKAELLSVLFVLQRNMSQLPLSAPANVSLQAVRLNSLAEESWRQAGISSKDIEPHAPFNERILGLWHSITSTCLPGIRGVSIYQETQVEWRTAGVAQRNTHGL